MEDDDKCEEYDVQLQTSFSLFLDAYKEYMGIELSEPSKEDITNIILKQSDLEQIINDLEYKISKLKSELTKCRKKAHKKMKSSLDSNEITFLNYKKKYYTKNKENKEMIRNFQESQTIEEENNKYKRPSKSTNKDKSKEDKKNIIESNNDDFDLELDENQLIQMKAFVDNDKNFIGCSQEELNQILQVKSQLKELLEMTRQKIDDADQDLQLIEANIDDAQRQIELGNAELKKAALIENKNFRLKAKALFSLTMGSVGHFFTKIPGAGPLFAILGARIGRRIAKKDKKNIENIEKNT